MLKIEHLFVSFTKEYYTLNDICVNLAPNQKLVIIGSKESGRTVFLRTLVGLEPISKGEVFYKNISLSKIDFSSDVSLGYIPARPAFLERKTVKQNIEYVLKLRKGRDNFIDEKVSNALSEYGLEYIKNKKARDLSYLDRIKLSLARLSVRPLDVLLIDDIFTTLSDFERGKLIKCIKDLVRNNSCTTIIMTDNEDVADKLRYSKKYLVYGSLLDEKDKVE